MKLPVLGPLRAGRRMLRQGHEAKASLAGVVSSAPRLEPPPGACMDPCMSNCQAEGNDFATCYRMCRSKCAG